MDRNTIGSVGRYALVALAIAALVVSGGTAAAAAGDGGADANDGATQIGSQRVVIDDAQITVGDVEVSGTGLPAVDIDERTYGIDHASLSADGVRVEWNGNAYQICKIDIVLKDVSVTVRNVSVN